MANAWVGIEPLPPMNGQVVSPYVRGILDLRWDDPATLGGNTAFTVVGVNIYRSDTSDRGPYLRLNESPVGGTFYRDSTDLALIHEVVQDDAWLSKGNAPNNSRWAFRTKLPISQYDLGIINLNGKAVPANAPRDVKVWINGARIEVHAVFGPQGEVTLVNQPGLDWTTGLTTAPGIPSGPDSVVEIQYRTARNHVRSGLDAKVSYRVATVVLDPGSPGGLRETPLAQCEPLCVISVSPMNYLWHEAIRRNHWILQEGGEPVKVFLRKQTGIPCNCGLDPRTREYAKQPSGLCRICYATGFVGGYEGPYEILIAPDDAERRISQGPTGRRLEHTYEVWTGPSPLITQRDLIVKQTNERYSIGPVRRPTHAGTVLQQHFTIGYIDDGDIRYGVPVDGTTNLPWPQTRATPPTYEEAPQRQSDGGMSAEAPFPVGPESTYPQGTGTPGTSQKRGRTPVWENQSGRRKS